MFTETTRQLLAVDASRRLNERTVFRVLPPTAAVANLLLCATFEPLLRNDPGGHFLGSFLFVQTAFLVALHVSYFGGRTSPVLKRTRIFPVTPADRFVSTVAIEIRRRIVLALGVSVTGFLAVFFRGNPPLAVMAVGTFLLLAVTVEIVTSAAALLIMRTPHPSAVALASAGVVILAMTIGHLLFGIGDLMAAVPLINWAAGGIMAAGRGDAGSAILLTGYIAALGAVGTLTGWRYS